MITVQPTYSRYNHSTGEIEDYTEDDFRSAKLKHVFVYFKSVYVKPPNSHTPHPFTDVT